MLQQEGNDVQIDVAFDVHDSLPMAMVHVTVWQCLAAFVGFLQNPVLTRSFAMIASGFSFPNWLEHVGTTTCGSLVYMVYESPRSFCMFMCLCVPPWKYAFMWFIFVETLMYILYLCLNHILRLTARFIPPLQGDGYQAVRSQAWCGHTRERRPGIANSISGLGSLGCQVVTLHDLPAFP